VPRGAGVAIIGFVQAPSFRDLTLAAFAERLASSDPVPGGGSASAVAAALGASLVAMVATLTLGRPKYAEHVALAEAVEPRARALANDLFELADADARAYAACAFALKLPRESFEDKAARDRQIRETAVVAAEVPLRSVERCLDVLGLAELLAGRSNRNASSDLRVASLLLEAAADGAAANVLVNLPLVGPGDWTSATEARVGELMSDVTVIGKRVRSVVEAGEARAPIADTPAAVTGAVGDDGADTARVTPADSAARLGA
jgi:formiminotetrahydrofolate cyclodeaminase